MRTEIINDLKITSVLTLQRFGHRAQIIKACEELGELTAVLCKYLNPSTIPPDQIVDEIADVIVMAFCMREFFGARDTDARVEYKLKRMGIFLEKDDTPMVGL